jgi:hypothetical protein
MPEEEVFSLADLTSVHFDSVTVSVLCWLSVQATDLPEVSLDLPKAVFLGQIFGRRGWHTLYH